MNSLFSVVFVRHGRKMPGDGRLEHDIPLDPAEVSVAESIRAQISARGLEPLIWISSHFAHAWQTAEALASPHSRVARVCALTPYSVDENAHLRPMLKEIGRLAVELNGLDCMGLVGHEERLSNMANELLPPDARITRLGYMDAVCIGGETLYDLDQRKSGVLWRISREGPSQL